jgi:hypothetical protein
MNGRRTPDRTDPRASRNIRSSSTGEDDEPMRPARQYMHTGRWRRDPRSLSPGRDEDGGLRSLETGNTRPGQDSLGESSDRNGRGSIPRASRESRHGDQGNNETSGQDEGRRRRAHETNSQRSHRTRLQTSTPGPSSLQQAVCIIIHLLHHRHRLQCNWPAANVRPAK